FNIYIVYIYPETGSIINNTIISIGKSITDNNASKEDNKYYKLNFNYGAVEKGFLSLNNTESTIIIHNSLYTNFTVRNAGIGKINLTGWINVNNIDVKEVINEYLKNNIEIMYYDGKEWGMLNNGDKKQKKNPEWFSMNEDWIKDIMALKPGEKLIACRTGYNNDFWRIETGKIKNTLNLFVLGRDFDL
ncbi:MAG: hypothetical protein M1308_01535, partial [Actinobacteria bacterium]|nr:hypothetical protein [Actinomycetota bacterium]